jgi:iron transport multicopper oxidase
MSWRIASLVVACALAAPAAPAAADDASLTNAADNARTGWYPHEPGLDPGTVAGSTFGQLFSATVTGQVYAQPLVSGATLLVATEANRVYGLDRLTGAHHWDRDLGTPFDARQELNCGDVAGTIGVTATPVIDPATNTAYLTTDVFVSGSSGPSAWYLHALDVATGDERTGFPVKLEGNAQNAPGVAFDATDQLQRPGLLLLDGAVYAGFGGHCDHAPYRGWVFGVSTAGQVTARWTAVTTTGFNGAGIWQSGGGLASDGPGQILLATGNGGIPAVGTAGSSPPGNLGESMVRLAVQSDGTLKATDFFAPYDAQDLDQRDADFGSGGPVALTPPSFGTPSHPHLMVATGKQGYVYLLDRDDLGGIATGPGGSDRVVQRTGPYGGVWSRPAVWPGDGGYVYVPTGSGSPTVSGAGALQMYSYGVDGSGVPSLALAGTSSDAFGFSTGAPVVTSDGTASGTALVWVVWSPNGGGSGAQLRAYDPVPVGGQPVLRFSAPVGQGPKFAPPGVSADHVYVGTRDGHVVGFGSPVNAAITGPAQSFPDTTVGETSQRTATLTAHRDLTLTSVSSSSPRFELGTPSPPLGTQLHDGDKVDVPVTFAPVGGGPVAASLQAESSGGAASVALSGTGLSVDAELSASPPIVSFGGTAVGGGPLTGSVTFTNLGSKPLTVDSVQLPSKPFSASGAPQAGDTLGPGDSLNVNVSFAPTAVGHFTDEIGLDTSGGEQSVGLSGSATPPGKLEIAPRSIDYGEVAAGGEASASFDVANTGGTAVTINKSKPPAGGPFSASTQLPEGTSVAAGATSTETVRFAPGAPGPAGDRWDITGDDGSGPHTVTFAGTGGRSPGAAPDATGAGLVGLLVPPTGGAARILAFTLAPERFRAPGSRARAPGSALVRYRLSGPGRVRFTAQRAEVGLVRGRACLTRVRPRRGERQCTRYVSLPGALVRSSAGGVGTLSFTGWIGGRRLAPGSYRLVATAARAASPASASRSVPFRLVG